MSEPVQVYTACQFARLPQEPHKRKEELAELEQTLERVQQKQISVQAVEQIEAKPLSLTSKMAIERDDYQALVTEAQKYVVQEKQEENLKSS